MCRYHRLGSCLGVPPVGTFPSNRRCTPMPCGWWTKGDSIKFNQLCMHTHCLLHCRHVPFIVCVAAGGTGLAGSTCPLFSGRASLAFAVGIVQCAANRTTLRLSLAAEGPVCTIDAWIETCEFFGGSRRTDVTHFTRISYFARRARNASHHSKTHARCTGSLCYRAVDP